MRYVGVDLAWGLRNPTGVAVLDEDGVLLDVTAVRTDEEILDRVRTHTDGPCLVAFDAPLVVTNETGRRECEALLNRQFQRFHAGAHPSNLTRPHFRDGTRAMRLLTRLGLDHLGAIADRRAIEVYPHPATITLFGLDRIIPYKQKSGRDVISLRRALLELIGHVERLADADPPLLLGGCPPWTALTDAAGRAQRKVELRRVEDPVDAVICAYIALYADRRPDRVRTFGEPEHGAIVVPVDDRIAFP